MLLLFLLLVPRTITALTDTVCAINGDAAATTTTTTTTTTTITTVAASAM